MTKAQKVDMLRTLMEGEEDSTAILSLYLDMAGQKILNRMYPYKESYDGMDVPDRYAMAQLKIASYMLNKRGAEGQIQHIENGTRQEWGAADIPDGMLEEIVPFCQVIS